MNRNSITLSIKTLLYGLALVASCIAGYFTAITTLKVKVEEHEKRLQYIENDLNKQLSDISKQLGELRIIVVRLEERVGILQEQIKNKRR